MDASNRNGWSASQQPAPSSSSAAMNPQQPQQAQQTAPSSGAPVLPPPSGAFFSNPPSQHNLPSLAGLAQSAQATPVPNMSHAQAHPSSEPAHQTPRQQPAYPLPGMGQHQLQPHPSIETDRERDARELQADELARHEAEQRERQQRDQQPHIHQPVARRPEHPVHGPGGVLSNQGPTAQSIVTQGTMTAAQALFGGGPMQQGADPTRLQQTAPQQQQAPMLVPFTAQGGQQPTGGMNQAQQPILNDALSYLDQVKVQFAEHPDVYNRFLDIMKDFKSGAIDTPGVIERVSQLFAGNPGLIQGFNTFLPPGYKIECGTGDDPNAIRVTTPMGTTISRMPAARPLSPRGPPTMNGNLSNAAGESAFFDATGRMAWQQQQVGAQEPGFTQDGRAAAQAVYGIQGPTSHAPLSPEAQREQQAAAAMHQQEQRGVSQLQNAAAAASAGALTNRGGLMSSPGDGMTALPAHMMNGISPGLQMANGGMEKRGPVEFNHAISYVNKIKNRFAQQPDIYKQFLEILQTYQRESKPIQDVYSQVTRLFETAPDLLEDFKQFLPESAAHSKAQNVRAGGAGEEAFPLSSARNETYPAAGGHQMHQTPRPDQARMPPMGNFGPTPTQPRENKRKRADRQGASSQMAGAGSVGPESSAGPRTNLAQTTNGNKRLKGPHGAKQAIIPEMSTVVPSLVPPLPNPLPPTTTLAAGPEDLSWFDRVRKHIGNKGQYGEFLKLLNLYTQDLCSELYLVFRAHSFIGNNPELMTFLKNFLHYDGSDEIIDNQPRNVHGKIQLSNCRGMGPSYRLLPKLQKHQKCSGRDALCNSVLNDEWVSHPTWASEDSGFVAHRKNTHEEGLHRVEEERHDYDFYIESCERTIQLLEPIAQQLNTLSPEARRTYTLDEKLGGQSTAIHKRVVYKIYGRERGNEVLENLFHRPYDVVPILLTRLRSKLAEWKAAQIQWQKVWRQQTNMLFYKSLDHQGVATRVADKRQFWPKQLINEAQIKYQEQKRQREISGLHFGSTSQFEYKFTDVNVLSNAAQLVIAYADQNFSTEYPKLVPFIQDFFTIFFTDSIVFGQESGRSNSSVDDGEESSPGPDDGSSSRYKSNTKQRDLRRQVFGQSRGTRGGKRDNDSSASDSRAASPVLTADDDMVDVVASPLPSDSPKLASSKKWFEHPLDNNPVDGHENVDPNAPYTRHVYNMYCNSTIYCFFRLFALLYERLIKLKENEAEVRKTVQRALDHKPAIEMGWIDKLPSEFFGDTSNNANYYDQVLDMFNGVIRSEVDMPMVEECLRRYYLQDGWQLYTIDKLLNQINRFAIGTLTNDGREKGYDIFLLFKKDRKRGEQTTNHEELEYRRQVDKQIKEPEVFRIAYDEPAKTARIQLIKPDDPIEPSAQNEIERWKVYVSAFESVEPTNTFRYTEPLHFPFLRRGVRQQHGEDQPTDPTVAIDMKSSEHLEFRIKQTNKYVMEFSPNASEYAVAKKIDISADDVMSEAAKRGSTATEKIEYNNAWMKDLSTDDVDKFKQAYHEKQEPSDTESWRERWRTIVQSNQ